MKVESDPIYKDKKVPLSPTSKNAKCTYKGGLESSPSHENLHTASQSFDKDDVCTAHCEMSPCALGTGGSFEGSF